MTMTSSELSQSLRVCDFGKLKIAERSLKQMLPDVETALFFCKVYGLDYHQLSQVMDVLFGDVNQVLGEILDGTHSTDLQDYLVDIIPGYVLDGDLSFSATEAIEPKGTILPELWAMAEIEVASSIRTVAEKVAGTLEYMPGKEGRMLFQHMNRLNRKRPTIGTYDASIVHPPAAPNLVIMDVSGSVTESTVKAIVADAVAMSYSANAHFAIVSNDTFHWDPGAYRVGSILAEAQYGGTYYETLIPLLQQNWGTVVTIADYDSSYAAKRAIKAECRGHIEKVLDISLVDTPTFLAECVGQLADEVQPLLVATNRYALTRY